ncbi:hypothetical protein J3459_006653 [Metarhizium acridum]|nr:hypothetical protein J3459_006653 [Metarhizium acridum]
MSVEDCQHLISVVLEQEFRVAGGDSKTLVYSNPSVILTSPAVQLWAESLEHESVMVEMQLPGIKRFLRRLAAYGVGYPADYNGVRYSFRPSPLSRSFPN